MQYLRGTESLFMDTLIESPEYFKLMEIVEDFYNTYLDEWLKLEVDGIIFGDDWGSQRSLLISPETWRKQYKPLYKRFLTKSILPVNSFLCIATATFWNYTTT